jgi:hypothetical protein
MLYFIKIIIKFGVIMADWRLFEQEIINLYKSLEGFNPKNPKNSGKIELFKKEMDNLIDKWSLAPILLYNSGVFRGHLQLDTQEERIGYYENYEKMQKEFLLNLNDKNLYNDNTVIGVGKEGTKTYKEYNFKSWSENNSAEIINLELPQKKALFATFVFMEQNVEYEVGYPFFTLISNPESKNASIGDCNGMVSLYCSFLQRINVDKDGNYKLEDAGKKNETPIFKNIEVQDLPKHQRLILEKIIVETTDNFIISKKDDEYLKSPKVNGSISMAISSQIVDTEPFLAEKNGDTGKKLKPVKVKPVEARELMLSSKLAYILNKGDNKVESNNLDYSYTELINDFIIKKQNYDAYKIALENGDKKLINKIKEFIPQKDIKSFELKYAEEQRQNIVNNVVTPVTIPKPEEKTPIPPSKPEIVNIKPSENINTNIAAPDLSKIDKTNLTPSELPVAKEVVDKIFKVTKLNILQPNENLNELQKEVVSHGKKMIEIMRVDGTHTPSKTSALLEEINLFNKALNNYADKSNLSDSEKNELKNYKVLDAARIRI